MRSVLAKSQCNIFAHCLTNLLHPYFTQILKDGDEVGRVTDSGCRCPQRILPPPPEGHGLAVRDGEPRAAARVLLGPRARPKYGHFYIYAIRIQILIILFSAIPKDKVCESSPIELNIVAYGQWNLGKLAGPGRDRWGVTCV